MILDPRIAKLADILVDVCVRELRDRDGESRPRDTSFRRRSKDDDVQCTGTRPKTASRQ